MTYRFFGGAPAALLALGIAAPAAAQELCGGAGGSGQWIGGSEASSDIATADSYREQMALVLSGAEYVSLFSVSEQAQVRVEAAGRGAGDPLIDIIDGSGNIIASDDDSGGEGASRAELSLAPGTYCMALSSYDGAPMTAFVRIGRTDQEPLTAGTGQVVATPDAGTDVVATDDTPLLPPSDSGGSCDAATPLVLGVPSTGSVEDTPFWSFTLDRSMSITVTAENPDADPYVVLYDAAGELLGENDDADGLNSRLDMTAPLAAGTYCLEVDAYNDTSLDIALLVEEYDPQAALSLLYSSGEAAPPMDGTVEITDLGPLNGRLRRDAQVGGDASWFSLTMPSAGLLLIEAIDGSTNGDPWVVVYDDLGRQIAVNDDYGEGLDSLIAARVVPGTYLIGVKQVETGYAGLIRLLFEHYTPAQ